MLIDEWTKYRCSKMDVDRLGKARLDVQLARHGYLLEECGELSESRRSIFGILRRFGTWGHLRAKDGSRPEMTFYALEMTTDPGLHVRAHLARQIANVWIGFQRNMTHSASKVF